VGIWRTGETHTVKTPLICHIVHEQYPHCAAVVGCRDCPESLLSRCVPYLQLNPFAVKVDSADFEIDTDRCDEGGREAVFTEA
jgi:hypothetical protein